ncbi:hypothetical protein N9Q12_00985 [bacterium]|nr:hypothetical protein [bacterium]
MDRFKRIINLVYAVCGILAMYIIALTLMGNSIFLFMEQVPEAVRNVFIVFGVISVVVAIINFSLFKKLTLWNK